jgi:TonB family protein
VPQQLDRIFADRLLRARRGRAASVVISALFHGALTAGFLFLPALFAEPKPQLEYVSVLVVPPSVLGIEEPPPPPPPRTPPPPPPVAPPPPPPPPPAPDVPVLPVEKKKPETRPATPPPPPAPPPRLQQDRPPRRQGSPTGHALGAASSQATLGVEDPNFTYGWYLDQVVNRITGNWTRPLVGPEARALFYFRIQREGTITELTLKEPSGFDEFDAAARRAVEASSPLPPLPRAYKPAFLGINLIVK